MDDSSKKSTRELVTLPPDLAERVEAFRQKTGMANKSESLKMLIEGGLRRYDSREDLLERCRAATTKGQSLGDIINFIVADHPLVLSTSVDQHSLTVYLRFAQDEHPERFRYARAPRKWFWEYEHPGDNDWRLRPMPKDIDDFGGAPAGGGRPSARGGKAELDDDIPF
jgi:hypothetical protein